uniref:BRCT domain-containing protein n=1 Tax=Anopheles maculatus TaxID=74869 RepID=A0A182SWQ4_9DIPT
MRLGSLERPSTVAELGETVQTDDKTHLVHLIHSMGGSIRKGMDTKVTHLICNSSGGEKYRYAMTFRLAIIRPNWVLEAWKNRHDHNFSATVETFTKLHRLKAFEGQKVCFFGFPEEEQQHMIDVLKTNGGIPTDLEDPECSHVVSRALNVNVVLITKEHYALSHS